MLDTTQHTTMMSFPNARNSLRRWNEELGERKIPVPVAVELRHCLPPAIDASTSSTQASAVPPSMKTSLFPPPPVQDGDSGGHDEASPTPGAKNTALKGDKEGHDQNEDVVPNHPSSPESPTTAGGGDDEEDLMGSINDNENNPARWYRPQHDANLLPRLRLDVVVDDDSVSSSTPDQGVTVSSNAAATILYSQTTMTAAVHPSWEHLDERINVSTQPNASTLSSSFSSKPIQRPWWEQDALYKSMRMQLFVVPKNEVDNKQGEPAHESPSCFMDVPLHPSLLHRIDDGRSNDSPTTDDFEAPNNNLPSDLLLPPNALLVHFSDGSVRCPLSLFQILWESEQLEEAPPVEDFSRFEDDVFRTLDGVDHTPQRRQRTASSLLDQDYEELQRTQEEGSLMPYMSPASPSLVVGTTHGNGNQEAPSIPEGGSNPGTSQPVQAKPAPAPPPLAIPFFEHQEIEARKADLMAERDLLRRLIEAEEAALEEDCQNLKEERTALADLVEECHTLESEMGLVHTELHHQEQKLAEEEFCSEAMSIKLVRELPTVYPITLSSNGGYMIRGLRLPVDIYTTTVPEEEVSAALGYCAHLVFMIAKYLNIPLRHRILCNSSRSAIQQDGVGVFPLFLGRLNVKALEREQVDKGLRLLGVSVNCILVHVGLLSTSNMGLTGAEDGSRVALEASTQQRQQNQNIEQAHILARLETISKFVRMGRTSRSKKQAPA